MSIFDTIKKTIFGDENQEETENRHTTHDHTHYERNTAEDDHQHDAYIARLLAEREEKDDFFANNPYHSPLAQKDLYNFKGLNYYDPNLAYQYVLQLRSSEPETVTFETSTGQEQPYERIGTVHFEVEQQPAQLAIYQSPDGHLFLPFRDATSGNETYGAGRYLEPIPLGNDELLVDFNRAYNPYCAYSEAYSCPLPPIENWLRVPIRAGERAYKEHH